jgi:hypothetical protein
MYIEQNINTMKKLLIILFSVGLAFGASAQRGVHGYHGGGGYYSRPRVVVGVGIGAYSPFYPYYGFGYGPWGFPYAPYYGSGYNAMPSRLALQVEDIKNDYQAQISDTRHDKSITGKERRQKIRSLKHDRDQAIIQAKRDYYYNSRKNYNNKNNDNNKNKGQGSNDSPQEYNDNSAGQ